MLNTPPFWGGVVVTFAVFGCDDGDPPDPPSDPVCSGDYSALASTEVSLQHDLMPIFGASCTFSSCHDSAAHKAGLVLGDPRSFGTGRNSCFDASAVWGCSIPEPIDPTLLKEVRDGLLAPSLTVKVPAVPRVTPGDPTKSFLLDKLTGAQNDREYAECTNQDPTRSISGSCGDAMPLGDSDFCAREPEKIAAIAKWIRDGAPQN